MITIEEQNKQILKDILNYPLRREITHILLHHSWWDDTKIKTGMKL
jgi:hypothetical protein